MMSGARMGLALLVVWGVVFHPPSPGYGQEAEREAADYARESSGTRTLTLDSGTSFRMLLDETNLKSGEVEVAEITLPAGMPPTGAHQHGSIEIFYVVEGVLGHEVNGEEHRIEPGMVGVVKPGDEVRHSVHGDAPVRALVIWVPGGEGDRVAPRDRWTEIEG